MSGMLFLFFLVNINHIQMHMFIQNIIGMLAYSKQKK